LNILKLDIDVFNCCINFIIFLYFCVSTLCFYDIIYEPFDVVIIPFLTFYKLKGVLLIVVPCDKTGKPDYFKLISHDQWLFHVVM
jgi:hypothetical protein